MTSVWDSFASGEYVKFDNPGDKIVGTIVDVSVHKWDDGSTCPKIVLVEDGTDETRILTANQAMLKAKLAADDCRPGPGDRIAIVHTTVERRAGGKTLKHFDVQVARGNGVAPTAHAAPPAAAPGYAPPAAVPPAFPAPAGWPATPGQAGPPPAQPGWPEPAPVAPQAAPPAPGGITAAGLLG